MENNQALFNLSIEPVAKNHLLETAKWAKFLAITGMVFLGLGVVGILFFSYYMSTMMSNVGGGYNDVGYGAGFGIGIAIFYILLLSVWFFPLMYLLRFANRARAAVESNDQQEITLAFQNLKVCFRYVGIVTIIVIALYAIALIFGIISFLAFT